MMVVMPGASAASPGNGAIAMGMRCAPAPVTSMVSWAEAEKAAKTNAIANSSVRMARLYGIKRTVLQLKTARRRLFVGLGQRRGLEDRALDRIIERRIAARLAQL